MYTDSIHALLATTINNPCLISHFPPLWLIRHVIRDINPQDNEGHQILGVLWTRNELSP